MPSETKRISKNTFFFENFIASGKWLLVIICTLSCPALFAQVPVPDFTANVTSGCSPVTVQFTDRSSGNPIFWNWDLGNGQLSTAQNPVASYSTPGTYTITLVVRNANGINSITKTDYIVVNPSPIASMQADKTIACVPATVQFTDQSLPVAGNIVSWEWDFGDGTTSTAQSPSHTFDSVGFYNIFLTVTSSTGCKNTVGYYNHIRVVSGVTPEFSFTQPATCTSPFQVNFTDLTSGPGTLTYQWNFGNSTNSTQQNPTATYAAPGTYTVQLTALSQYGCSATVQKTVDITSTNTNFTSPDTVCLNTVVNFQNNASPDPVSTLWDFGNGQQSTKPSDTMSYSTPGTYAVKLVNTYQNCKDSITRNIVVSPRPMADFTAPAVVACRAPFAVSFQDISPNAVSWQWDFGDGGTSAQQNPTHTYNAEGQFNVRLTITDSRGCTNTITKSSFIRIVKPTVAISNAPAGGCVPFTFSPTANVNALDGVASYYWDFGDGFTSTVANPSHTYAAVGSYTMKLVITTTGGCRDSIVIPSGVRVGTPPATNFTASPLDVCAFQPVSFVTDPTTIADEFSWNFGDGGSSSQKDPQHSYTDTGLFSVTLIAINNGCPQPFTRNLYIHVRPPIADFDASVNCTNKRQVNFINTSQTDAAYGPVTYLWQFGDPANTTSTLPNPSFTYPALGTYTAQLTVNNGSCSHTFSRVLSLNGDIADFTVSKTNLCKNEVFTITAVNSTPSNIASYEWSYDGGPFQTQTNQVQAAFATVGNHTITLLITDVNGCKDTLTRTNVVTVSGPTALFNLASNGFCRNSTVTFNDQSTATSSIVKWTWNFGDGNTQVYTSGPFTHVYNDTGFYAIRLTVEDQNGCTDTYTYFTNIQITKPVARFDAAAAIICPGANLQFTDSSSGAGLTYNWSFGDGNSSTQQNPTHVYAGTDSVYTVKLVVTDSIGCIDSVTRTNFITTRRPKPAFTLVNSSTICPPLETLFTFQGSDYESFYWDFGDGITSTLTNPKHFYNSYGTFVPKLYLIGYGGCIDSASDSVNVYNPATATTLTYSPLDACNSLMVDFNITTPPNTKMYFFSGDGGVDSSQNKVFQYFYKSFGYFSPSILLRDSFGCNVPYGGANQIRILGAEPLFGVDKKAFCDSGTVLFANYTIGNDPVVSSVWDFGDGNTSNATDPTHTYTVPGTYLPSLTVNTQAGCSKTLRDTVRVYGTPNPSIQGDTVVCIGANLFLEGVLAVPDTAITWSWTFGNGRSSTIQNPSTSYPATGRYPITLEAANKLGCKMSTSGNVYVPPTPVVTVAYNPVIPVGTSVPLPVTYSPNISSYVWTPATGLNCDDCSVPVATPKSTTKYKVDVTDIYGCTASNELTVVVVCNDKNYFVPNTFSPNGDGSNDVFYPRGTGLARVQSMRIFNRWGELVYERKNFMANDASAGWDGNFKGKKANADTYVYMVEFVCDNSIIVPYKGNITLIR